MSAPGLPTPDWRARAGQAPSPVELVRIAAPGAAHPLAALLRPALAGVDLCGWTRAHRAELNSLQQRHGALLLRGFDGVGAQFFQLFLDACGAELMDYKENTSPRRTVQGYIRTSTEYAADQRILLHNEQSHSLVVPRTLYLHCVTAPATGGETPLADCRKVLARIDPQVRERFRIHGWKYIRQFGLGLGPRWESVYQLDSLAALSTYCAGAGIELFDLGAGRLRTEQVRPAEARHPLTGESVWFNHAAFWHRSSLDPQMAALLPREGGEAVWPDEARYGDGWPIADAEAAHLRAAYDGETVMFPWQRGDILVLDNFLVAHGRAPFTGPREILFAMADPYRRDVKVR